MKPHDELLEYYQRELTYLRKVGAEFAERYPKIAGRLELNVDRAPDPHIERLIESFAFLTGRLQYNIDSRFPEIAAPLLNVLYPHYLNPIPSMAIARFEVNPAQVKLTDSYVVPKHTGLFARSHQGITMRFRTCYPVDLYPINVVEAAFEPSERYDFLDNTSNVATVLRIRVRAVGTPFTAMNLSRLRFFLNGEKTLVYPLYEMLFANVLNIAILPDGSKKPNYLSTKSVQPVGFAPDEEALPYPGNAHPQYRLLQEYFAFPDKFLFFDIDSLDLKNAEHSFDILILLDQTPKSRLVIDKNTFLLGCTPIINLFKKTSDPIRLDQRLPEYPLVPDMRREQTTEIHSILKVSASSDELNETQIFEPLYSYNHTSESVKNHAFWYARRQKSQKKTMNGTEIMLSLLDLHFKPAHPPTQMVYAHTLCMNRHRAQELPAGAILSVEEAIPTSRVVCLTKPTAQFDPPLGGETMWRLISHLSLNYLSLSGQSHSLKAFKEILRLYNFTEEPSIDQQIMGIREMSGRKVVRRMGKEAWRGFVHGTEITLTFDEDLYVGSSAFLLASVLNRFFGLYASINSFTQLVIRSSARKGEWKRWQPMAGEIDIL